MKKIKHYFFLVVFLSGCTSKFYFNKFDKRDRIIPSHFGTNNNIVLYTNYSPGIHDVVFGENSKKVRKMGEELRLTFNKYYKGKMQIYGGGHFHYTSKKGMLEQVYKNEPDTVAKILERIRYSLEVSYVNYEISSGENSSFGIEQGFQLIMTDHKINQSYVSKTIFAKTDGKKIRAFIDVLNDRLARFQQD